MPAPLTVATVGKTRRGPLRELEAELLRRIGRYARIERRAVPASARRRAPERRREEGRALAELRTPRSVCVGLDSRGQAVDSAGFRGILEAWRRRGPVLWLVGGPDGLPEGVLTSCDAQLSLGPMTLPHELALVVLLEQIYRALAAEQGHPYSLH